MVRLMSLFSLQNLTDLLVLVFLQAVLGFDNLLYIAIESKRAPAERQPFVRRMGIGVALVLRIVLLFVVIGLLDAFAEPFVSVHWTGVLEVEINFATVVFFLGGGFIMYTAVKEIHHMLAPAEHEGAEKKPDAGVNKVIFMIVLMNLIFSFDSILSAVAITRVTVILAAAIIVSGIMMILLADRVSEFIQRNRQYEVLGLFILLIVGVVLVGEGGHESHMKVFGHAVEPLAKSTFYFSVAVLSIVDILQSRYQKRLAQQRTWGRQA